MHILETKSWGMKDPEPTTGAKTPEYSIQKRSGEVIYQRGKNLRKWLGRTMTGFEDMWRNPDGTESYDFQQSETNSVIESWRECEDKVYPDMDANMQPGSCVPVELKLTFRYVCPDSPYLTHEHATLAGDALCEQARNFFFGFGSTGGDKRYFIDPRTRLEHSNKDATEKRQKLLLRATSGLGGDPSTPGALIVPQAPPPSWTPQ